MLHRRLLKLIDLLKFPEPARFGPKYKTLEVRVGERANMICAASGELPVRLEWLDKASNVIQANDKRFM